MHRSHNVRHGVHGFEFMHMLEKEFQFVFVNRIGIEFATVLGIQLCYGFSIRNSGGSVETFFRKFEGSVMMHKGR